MPADDSGKMQMARCEQIRRSDGSSTLATGLAPAVECGAASGQTSM